VTTNKSAPARLEAAEGMAQEVEAPMQSNTVARAAFSRQHYVAIADAISGGPTESEIIDALCALFTEDNPRFDRDRFLAACTGAAR
jgi:hypothetical protein